MAMDVVSSRVWLQSRPVTKAREGDTSVNGYDPSFC